MWDWITPVLQYIGELGGDVGSFLGDLFGGGGEAALGGGLADAYGPGAASFLGDVESGLGGGMDLPVSLGADALDFGSTASPLEDLGMGGDFWNAATGSVGDLGGIGETPPYYLASPDYGSMRAAGGGFVDAPGMYTEDVANVPGGPTGTSTSDILRSRAGEMTAGANWNPQDAVIGTQPFTGLTANPLSSIPGQDWSDVLKSAGQMASNFLKGAASGLGGGAGGGGADPFSLAMAGRGVPSVGPAGAPNYLGVGPVPSGASPPIQLASMGGLPAAPRQPGEQTVGGNPLAQAMGIPQAANLGGQPVGSPNTFGAPTPRNLNPFSPMMIPLPQAPLYPGIQNQPMSGLQRLMMAG